MTAKKLPEFLLSPIFSYVHVVRVLIALNFRSANWFFTCDMKDDLKACVCTPGLSQV